MKKSKKKTAKAVEKKIKKSKQEIVDKIQSKEDEKNKKILKLVKKELHLPDEISEPIAKSVIVNKNLIKRDEKILKKWQEEYYMSLFMKFKGLILEHNEAMGFKAEELANDIDGKNTTIKRLKQELGKLKEEIKSLKIEKGILVDA